MLAVLMTSAAVDDGVAAVQLLKQIDPVESPRLKVIGGDSKEQSFNYLIDFSFGVRTTKKQLHRVRRWSSGRTGRCLCVGLRPEKMPKRCTIATIRKTLENKDNYLQIDSKQFPSAVELADRLGNLSIPSQQSPRTRTRRSRRTTTLRCRPDVQNPRPEIPLQPC